MRRAHGDAGRAVASAPLPADSNIEQAIDRGGADGLADRGESWPTCATASSGRNRGHDRRRGAASTIDSDATRSERDSVAPSTGGISIICEEARGQRRRDR